ncbi:hypothetical protein Pcinc_016986 [Petrolisthes cinctipes]|uniref:Uncharacterized protein n=1 Tax=Petrolisthes cinctipes TaxID=88211 RepID=A0AAE1FSG8_PETCI|nr:hypothetical protein Pcinc_016986 [Petrolisthes cinctipes]
MTTPLENVDSDEPTQPTLLEEDSDLAPSPVGESPRRPAPLTQRHNSRLTTLDLLLVPKSCISYASSRIRGGRKRLKEEGKMQREEGKSKREEEKTTSGSLHYLQPCQLVTQMSHHRVMYNGIRDMATPHNSATFGNIAAGSQTTRPLERVPATTDENSLRSLVPYSLVLDLA